jgi:hypothetical protein
MTATPPKSTLLTVNLTSTDEDEQAEYGMDAIDWHAARQSLQAQAIQAFGPGITNFSRHCR